MLHGTTLREESSAASEERRTGVDELQERPVPLSRERLQSLERSVRAVSETSERLPSLLPESERLERRNERTERHRQTRMRREERAQIPTNQLGTSSEDVGESCLDPMVEETVLEDRQESLRRDRETKDDEELRALQERGGEDPEEALLDVPRPVVVRVMSPSSELPHQVSERPRRERTREEITRESRITRSVREESDKDPVRDLVQERSLPETRMVPASLPARTTRPRERARRTEEPAREAADMPDSPVRRGRSRLTALQEDLRDGAVRPSKGAQRT